MDYKDLKQFELNHFVWFGHYKENSFKLIQYLSILSALEVLGENGKIIFHTDREPENTNKFWNNLKQISKGKLIIFKPDHMKIEFIDDNHKSASHMNDVYRILVLLHFGGIYRDIETISTNSVHDLIEDLSKAGKHHYKNDEPNRKVFASQITSNAISIGFLVAPRNSDLLLKSVFRHRLIWCAVRGMPLWGLRGAYVTCN